MTDVEFWSLIDTSRQESGGTRRRHEQALRKKLRQLSADDVAEFEVRYDNLIRKAYNWDLWGAAYVIIGRNRIFFEGGPALVVGFALAARGWPWC